MSMSPRHPVDPVDDRAGAEPAPASPSRRRFVRSVGLGAAALGAAAATGAGLTGVASAQSSSSSATLPDLVAADVSLVQFLESVSLAAESGLASAADAPYLDSAVAELLRGFSRHHRDHATTFAALIPKTANITTPNPKLLSELTGKVDGAANQAALLGVVQAFEEQMAATMLAGVGQARSWVLASTISSIAPIVGQMAAAIGSTAGQPVSQWLPAFASTNGALAPSAYPVS